MTSRGAGGPVAPPSYRFYRLVLLVMVVTLSASLAWGALGHGPAKELERPVHSATSWAKERLGVDR